MVEYREIPGFPGYRVGADGIVQTCLKRVWVHTDDWKPLAPSVSRVKGRKTKLVVQLSCNGKRASLAVHRVVLEAFVGPCPEGMEACHFPDPDPVNNRIENLRWDTQRANTEDKMRLGRQTKGSEVHGAKLKDSDVIEMRRLAAEGVSRTEIMGRFGVSRNTVRRAIVGENWKHV
jgi:hypothetical protein